MATVRTQPCRHPVADARHHLADRIPHPAPDSSRRSYQTVNGKPQYKSKRPPGAMTAPVLLAFVTTIITTLIPQIFLALLRRSSVVAE
ncbi:hypothetical protein RHSP_83309 [Rhizobium freirei PRF 81]|uniref:Uncharacterized protein n=1 Tax=Rhizobium freirei PRF 81 TaxID=363754 RepID=N6UTW4_9HYPH|nr:hypothetical protein [Rhizobium freirei]ENN84246.1 hypothetical protein RHSP_83309 [Rhizobium freirei PRF 81]